MNAKTLKALKGSIAKWQAVVAGKGADEGGNNCPLCQMFFVGVPISERCIGCPVAKRAKTIGCYKTPWQEWAAHQDETGYARTQKQKRLARAELRFLKSLLPRKRK